MRQAYERLADLARDRDLPGVQRFFAEEIHRTRESKLEAVMSALWRLQVSVLDVFFPAVRAMVRAGGVVDKVPSPASQQSG